MTNVDDYFLTRPEGTTVSTRCVAQFGDCRRATVST